VRSTYPRHCRHPHAAYMHPCRSRLHQTVNASVRKRVDQDPHQTAVWGQEDAGVLNEVLRPAISPHEPLFVRTYGGCPFVGEVLGGKSHT